MQSNFQEDINGHEYGFDMREYANLIAQKFGGTLLKIFFEWQ